MCSASAPPCFSRMLAIIGGTVTLNPRHITSKRYTDPGDRERMLASSMVSIHCSNCFFARASFLLGPRPRRGRLEGHEISGWTLAAGRAWSTLRALTSSASSPVAAATCARGHPSAEIDRKVGEAFGGRAGLCQVSCFDKIQHDITQRGRSHRKTNPKIAGQWA